MAVITGLQTGKNKNRVNVLIDSELLFTVNRAIALKYGLKKGVALTAKEISELKHADSLQSCYDAALDFLGYRPRSEYEVRQRMRHRGFEPPIVTEVVAMLHRNDMLDDRAFALYWKNSRESSKPRSRSIIKNELLRKGISREIADDIAGEVDDEENAYNAGKKKIRALKNKTYDEFRERMFSYLKWKGFSFEIISKTTERLWKELEALSIE